MQLTQGKINYLFFHLAFYWKEQKEISDCFCFENAENIKNIKYQNKIVFPLSQTEDINPVIVNVLDTDIPILYPLNLDNKELYYLDSSGNLIFSHDYLKSSFYFLSGLQELNVQERDNHGRFQYKNSIQKKLNCINIPVVNYYFEIILQGLDFFCKQHGIAFTRKRLFETFGFFLSHDVDQIAFYHWRETAIKIKQLLGISPLIYSKSVTLKLFLKGLLFLINPFRKKDPWWNFEELINFEEKLGIQSAFYFLYNENRKKDSLYKFSNKKIKTLFKTLINNSFEVGLHGTYNSAENQESMLMQVKEYVTEFGYKPDGIRQHFLRFFNPLTFVLQEKAGFKYDTSLSFAEHEGYRNGYCYPFKPFDFENDCIMNIWEIPLIMMEVTALNYRKLDFIETKESVFQLIREAEKFGGIFSLLWHNSRMTEYEYPGIKLFYNSLLKSIVEKKPVCFNGKDLTLFNQLIN